MASKGTERPVARTAQNLLSPKQEVAAVSLAGGATQKRAAASARVSTTTVKNWGAEEAFQDRVTELRSQLSGRVLGQLARGMLKAVTTLRKLCASEAEGMRLKASEALLSHGAVLMDLADLRRRLIDLERQREAPRS